jgi:hypothetical protein
MTEETKLLRHIGVTMTERAQKYMTPVLLGHSDGSAELIGTGTYLQIDEQYYLLTCDHVTEFGEEKPIYVRLDGREEVIPGPHGTIFKQPEDLSLGALPEDSGLTGSQHNSAGLQLSAFALQHQPVEGEILFVLGTPGEGSAHIALLETTFVNAEPILVSEAPRLSTDPPFIFCISYRPETAIDVEGGSDRPALSPQGFSGSLVWNTRFVEFMQANRPWSADCALVTGMLRRWDTGVTQLTCCRSEWILSFINTAMSSDPASFPLR